MSRCFPFPPPGYERKLIVDNGNLLPKEKNKDKKESKHRRDKDKDKKEGTENGRERSKERHREKDKEKKEKHKHKDRDKKNEKKRSRDETTGEKSNAEKVGSSSPPSSQVSGTSCVELEELVHRICHVYDAAGNRIVHVVNDGKLGKSEILDRLAGSNNDHRTESKSGFDEITDGQRDHCQEKFSKVAFVSNPNRGEQRTMNIGRPIEKNIDKSSEGNHMQKRHRNDKGDEKDRNANRLERRVETCSWDKNGHDGAHVVPSKEALVVQEFERRVRDENNATGSQVSAQTNVNVQKRAQSNGKVANCNGSYPARVKEIAKFGTGNFSLGNGWKDNNQSKRLKVAILHNSETLEHVDKSKEAVLEETLRNGFIGNGGVDNKGWKIQTKDEYKYKPLKEDNVKQGSDCIVKLSRLGGNGSDPADNAKLHVLNGGYKPAEEITGKRKEPEGILHVELRNKASEGVRGKRKDPVANGNLHENEKQPDKWQRTVLSSKPVTENGRKLQSGGTSTPFASNQGGANGVNSEEHKYNGSVRARSPLVSKIFPSSTAKATGPVRAQSPHYSTTLPAPAKAYEPLIPVNSIVRAQSPHYSTTLPPGKANGPLITVKANLAIGVQESSQSSTQPNSTIHGTMGSCQTPLGSTKPPSTKAEASGTPMMLKSSASSAKDKKHKNKSLLKPWSPHPDTKYLSQILSVPKMEWSELDDPVWLLDSRSFSSKKVEEGCGRDGGEPQVWAKAVHINSTGVYALPYVIPY